MRLIKAFLEIKEQGWREKLIRLASSARERDLPHWRSNSSGKLPAGEGEPRCCGRGRRVLGGVREGPEGQPVQGLESDVVGLVYPPPPCGFVEIPKDNGGTRPLGIPTIADRVPQTVVKMVLEPLVEAGATVLGFGSQYPWTRRVYRTTHCAP